MLHTTNYTNAFIEVADDCKAEKGVEPPLKTASKSIARLQYELIAQDPYGLTSDELLFSIQAMRHQWPDETLSAEKERLFSKGQPCMRSSDLPKKYGWGIHFDDKARMALYAVDSIEYAQLKSNPALMHKKAMRNAKSKLK